MQHFLCRAVAATKAPMSLANHSNLFSTGQEPTATECAVYKSRAADPSAAMSRPPMEKVIEAPRPLATVEDGVEPVVVAAAVVVALAVAVAGVDLLLVAAVAFAT